MYTWRLSNHGSDGEGSVDKNLAAPQRKKKVWEPFFSPLSSPHPPRRSPALGAGDCVDGSHTHWLAEPPSRHFCTSLVPSSGFAEVHLPPDARPHLALLSRCQESSTLEGRWELVLSAPRGRPENLRSHGKVMSSTMKLIVKSFRPSGCMHDPGKGSVPQVPRSPVKAEGTQRPTRCIQHLSESTQGFRAAQQGW